MAGVKGRSGTNKRKSWSDALRIVGNRTDKEGLSRLLRIAEKCFAAAEAGDIAAMKEIGDRIDGKAVQEQNVTVTRVTASDLSDNELADIAAGSSEGTSDSAVDPSQLN